VSAVHKPNHSRAIIYSLSPGQYLLHRAIATEDRHVYAMIPDILVILACLLLGSRICWVYRRRTRQVCPTFGCRWQCSHVQVDKVPCSYHHCLPAPRLPNQRPWGIDRIEQLFRADAESRLMGMFSFYFQQTGHTFEHVLLGTAGLATIEPDNIAAVLTRTKGAGGFRCTGC
jgi:hypothetical protein